MNNSLKTFLFIPVLSFLIACSNQVPPAGGPKDTTPPKVENSEPENHSTNFHSKEIRITFDEYVQLKDINTQLLVSPPLKITPETRIKKKTLFILIEDTLQENTTYSMNFGNAIADNHEGNVLDNYVYVFSTGNVVDTLSLVGKVLNAVTVKPEKDVKVMLYKSEDDSLPYKKVPFYFGVTNEAGTFVINNISEGQYKIFALKETNNNYLYDSPDESIAFLEKSVKPGTPGLELKLYNEKPPVRLSKVYSSEPGKVVIEMNRPSPGLKIEFMGDTSGLDLELVNFTNEKDTAIVWYRNVLRDSLALLIRSAEKTDTAIVRLQKANQKSHRSAKFGLTLSTNTSDQHPFDFHQPLVISASHPVRTFSTGQISLYEDSLPVKPDTIISTDDPVQKFQVRYSWKENKKYTLTIPKGSVTDIYNLTNDSLKVKFTTHAVTDYGSLQVKIKTGKPGAFVFQLVDLKDIPVKEVSFQADTVMMLEYLTPASYKMRIYTDKNKNGKLDPGYYLDHLQPEPVVYYPENIMVRANWDVEVSWEVMLEDSESSR